MTKNIYFAILVFFLGFGFVHAQQDIETGPLAKNRKPWKNPKPQTLIVIKKGDFKKITGPLAKNRKRSEEVYETIPVVFRERKKLTGPLAKNARPERGNYWETDTKE